MVLVNRPQGPLLYNQNKQICMPSSHTHRRLSHSLHILMAEITNYFFIEIFKLRSIMHSRETILNRIGFAKCTIKHHSTNKEHVDCQGNCWYTKKETRRRIPLRSFRTSCNIYSTKFVCTEKGNSQKKKNSNSPCRRKIIKPNPKKKTYFKNIYTKSESSSYKN